MFNHHLRLLGATLLVLASWLSLPGCGVTSGLFMVSDEPPTTAQMRTHAETIPSAQLVREDTMPRWQLGRHAFRRGVDRLLVLTNITSFATKEGDKPAKRRDAILERIWIVIPEGTPVGTLLDMEQLAWERMIGYDAGLLEGPDAGQFIQPFRLTGKVAVLEEKGDTVAMYVNVLVQPKELNNWSYKGTFDVPQTIDGIYASKVSADPRSVYVDRLPVRQVATIPTDETPNPNPIPPAATQPAATATQPDEAATQPVNRSVVGMWINESPRWYERFQFNKDGTFIHANCRPDYDPAIHTGTYEIKGQYLIVTVTAYTYKSVGATSVDSKLLTKPDVGLLKMTWDKDKLHLQGTMFRRGRMPLDMIFSPASFPDMALVPPPSRW